MTDSDSKMTDSRFQKNWTDSDSSDSDSSGIGADSKRFPIPIPESPSSTKNPDTLKERWHPGSTFLTQVIENLRTKKKIEIQQYILQVSSVKGNSNLFGWKARS